MSSLNKAFLALLILLSSKTADVSTRKLRDDKLENLKIKGLSDAFITAIQNNSFTKIDNKFEFIIVHEQCQKFALQVIERIMKKCSNISTVETKMIDSLKVKEIAMDSQKIIFVESDTSFNQSLHDKFYMSKIDFQEEYNIIIICNVKFKGRVTLGGGRGIDFSHVKFFTHIQFLHYNELTKYVESIGFAGVSENCVNAVKITNFFDTVTKRWEIQSLIIKRFENFHNCTLRFNYGSGKVVFNFYYTLLSDLRSKYNFKFTLHDEGKGWPSKDDLKINSRLNNLDLWLIEYYLFVIFSAEQVLLYNTGEAYSELEKLFLPFDSATWIMIITVFFSGFLTISFLKLKLLSEQQRFVFGSRVKTPIFNMVTAFFGQSQNILPGRNFARYHLMLFILFCLIIRTAYQGVQYELMLTVSWIFNTTFYVLW